MAMEICTIQIYWVNYGEIRFFLDITHGQSLRDTYSIMSLSDWTGCSWSDIPVHGLNMTCCIGQAASWPLAFVHSLIHSLDGSVAPTLTATCSLFPCVGHTCGSVDDCVTWLLIHHEDHPGPDFCLLLGVSSGCARPITGQVTTVTWPVIGWA